jgi:hypothetical protein
VDLAAWVNLAVAFLALHRGRFGARIWNRRVLIPFISPLEEFLYSEVSHMIVWHRIEALELERRVLVYGRPSERRNCTRITVAKRTLPVSTSLINSFGLFLSFAAEPMQCELAELA